MSYFSTDADAVCAKQAGQLHNWISQNRPRLSVL